MFDVSTTSSQKEPFPLTQLKQCKSEKVRLHSDVENEALILNGCLDFLTSKINEENTGYIFMALQSMCKNIIDVLDKIEEIEQIERNLIQRHERESD